MKIKSIASILRSTNSIHIYRNGSELWLCNGYATYAVYNLPFLSKEQVLTILDIPEEKQNNYFIKEYEELPEYIKSNNYTEYQLNRTSFFITWLGTTYEVLFSPHGLLLVNTKYLKPFDEIKDGYTLVECIPYTGNKRIIRVKAGFLIVGAIAPSSDVLLSESFQNNVTNTKAGMEIILRQQEYEQRKALEAEQQNLSFDDLEAETD